MLKNYTKTIDGIIKQVNINPYKYDMDYINSNLSYTVLPQKQNMSFLRLGFVIGSVGHIPSSIMDVGYGSGGFLEVCTNIIPKVYGNDVPPAYPLPTGVEFVDNIFEQEVEVITFFDCLEHFEDIEFVKNLKCKYIIVSLPWCHNGDDDEWFEKWKHRKPDEHLHHFDEKTLNTFMSRQGYTLKNYCNLEDTIRIDKNLKPNILTACFEKN